MSNKIKILRLITRMNVGGPALHCYLLNGLNNNEFETKLFSGLTEDNEKHLEYGAQILWNIQNLKKSIDIKEDWKVIKTLIQEIKRYKPDIVHTHLSKAGFVGRIAAIWCRAFYDMDINIVHTYHGTVFKHYFGWFKSKLYLYIDRFLALFTQRIIAISESQKSDLIKLGFNKKKIRVIKLGLNLEEFNFQGPKDPKFINVGIIGRLEPIKNHRMFLDAISHMKNNGFKFYIIGDGSLRPGLEEYCNYLNIDVIFTGNLERDMLLGYYGFLDVVVNCSLNEGTPLSLIEAMASECLVIATDVGGTKDLMGNNQVNFINSVKYCDNGYLIESNNYKQLAMMLRYYNVMHDTRYVKQRIENASKFVKENYSKERLLTDIEQLYKELVI